MIKKEGNDIVILEKNDISTDALFNSDCMSEQNQITDEKKSGTYLISIKGPHLNTTLAITNKEQMDVINAMLSMIKTELKISDDNK
mgnify:CR=1 FL=1